MLADGLDDVGSLVSAGDGVRALFAAKEPAQRLHVSSAAFAQRDQSGTKSAAVQLDTSRARPGRGRRRGYSRAGYVGGGARRWRCCLLGGGVSGKAAEAPSLGNTRAEMQSDLERRERYVSAATSSRRGWRSSVVGGVLGIVVARHRDNDP